MIVAKNIYNADGIKLLSNNVVLTSTYIRKLQTLNINSVFIKNPLFSDIEPPEIINETTRVQAIHTVSKAFKEFKTSKRINLKKFEQTANRIIREAILNRHSMVHLTDIRTHDDYTFGHSVNVCILATIVGLQAGFNPAALKVLALGSLLHDLGKTFIPNEILGKQGRLSEDEFAVVKQHSQLGYDILHQEADELSRLVPLIALQHHERYNGHGYPNGLAGDDIHQHAQIVAAVDVYDALTSDRPYHQALLPHEAYELMLSLSGSQFSPAILTNFLGQIAAYPVGTIVLLNTGQLGIVVRVFPKLQLRPTIRLLTDEYGNCYPDQPELDLTKRLTVFITKTLTDREIYELPNKLRFSACL